MLRKLWMGFYREYDAMTIGLMIVVAIEAGIDWMILSHLF